MIYRIQNPYDHTTTTEINTVTNEAWHYSSEEEDRVLSLHKAHWWLKHYPPPVDPDYEVDEGL